MAGREALAALAKAYGCAADESLVKKMVYKYTDCGAWIAFTPEGVRVGSIVEGSAAEVPGRDVPHDGGDADFLRRYWAAVAAVESAADALWQEANNQEE